jgi:hypothetical protein
MEAILPHPKPLVVRDGKILAIIGPMAADRIEAFVVALRKETECMLLDWHAVVHIAILKAIGDTATLDRIIKAIRELQPEFPDMKLCFLR